MVIGILLKLVVIFSNFFHRSKISTDNEELNKIMQQRIEEEDKKTKDYDNFLTTIKVLAPIEKAERWLEYIANNLIENWNDYDPFSVRVPPTHI